MNLRRKKIKWYIQNFSEYILMTKINRTSVSYFIILLYHVCICKYAQRDYINWHISYVTNLVIQLNFIQISPLNLLCPLDKKKTILRQALKCIEQHITSHITTPHNHVRTDKYLYVFSIMLYKCNLLNFTVHFTSFFSFFITFF